MNYSHVSHATFCSSQFPERCQNVTPCVSPVTGHSTPRCADRSCKPPKLGAVRRCHRRATGRPLGPNNAPESLWERPEVPQGSICQSYTEVSKAEGGSSQDNIMFTSDREVKSIKRCQHDRYLLPCEWHIALVRVCKQETLKL